MRPLGPRSVLAVVLLGWVAIENWTGATDAPRGQQWVDGGSLTTGQLYRLAGDPRQVDAELEFDGSGRQYLLIVANLSRHLAGQPAALSAQHAAGFPVGHRRPQRPWQPLNALRFARGATSVCAKPQRLATAPLQATQRDSIRTARALRRAFWLRTSNGPGDDQAGIERVGTCLAAEGAGVRVWVDESCAEATATARWLVSCYEQQIEPGLIPWIGRPADVDGDGHLAVVLTPRVKQVSGGPSPLGALVLASDFDGQDPAPHANRADVIWVASDQRPGAHLATLLAHELAHAVRAGHLAQHHAALWWPPSTTPASEPTWLSEGLAHTAENLASPALSNLRDRVAAYLRQPGQAPLVVPSDRALGRYRDPALRGACYLFTCWCVEQAGPRSLGALLAGSQRGEANLRAVLGHPLEELYPRWACDLWCRLAPPASRFPGRGTDSSQTAQRCGQLKVAWEGDQFGPPETVSWNLADAGPALRLAGTAHRYFLVSAPHQGRWRLRLKCESAGPWQIYAMPCRPPSAVRLAAATPDGQLRAPGR